MKKNILKAVIAVVFIVGIIVSFNTEAIAGCQGEGSYNNGHCAQGSGGANVCVEKAWFQSRNCYRTPPQQV